MILVRHGTLEVRYADISFFYWFYSFTCAMDFGEKEGLLVVYSSWNLIENCARLV